MPHPKVLQIKELTREFLLGSTWHGTAQVVVSPWRVGRLVWGLLTVALIIISIVQSNFILKRFLSRPVEFKTWVSDIIYDDLWGDDCWDSLLLVCFISALLFILSSGIRSVWMQII